MKDLLLRNWHLKLISLVLATVLWVARTPTSEIGLSVSLEYQNIPPETEVFGDTTDRVEVRLRGPSSLVRTLSSQDLSLSIDMTGMTLGQENILALSPELVHAPVGVEVVRVIPSRVKLSMERTAKQSVRIYPRLVGSPAAGFEIEKSVVTPETVEIEGPASHVQTLETIDTAEIDIRGRQQTFRENVELDVEDPIVRIPNLGPIDVEVRIRRK
jgi:YbbR domain-containing protein